MALVGKVRNARQQRPPVSTAEFPRSPASEAPVATELRDINYHFFAEVFVTEQAPAALVQGAVLSGPGRARVPAAFPSRGVDREVHGGRWTDADAYDELEAAYPDGEYSIWYNTTGGDMQKQVVPHDRRTPQTHIPEPPHISLFQGGRAVSVLDPAQDAEIRWSPFATGGPDPHDVCPDLIFFEVWDCFGRGVLHSGDPFVTTEYLTYANKSFVVPAGTLLPGQLYQLSVEHSKLVTAAPSGVLPPALGTFSATTYMDIGTSGLPPAGLPACPAVPWQADPGQTDRQPWPLADRCEAEVRRFHVFFEDWYNARVPKDWSLFDASFASALDDRFQFVSPVGLPDNKSATIGAIFSAWGTTDMRIVLTNVTTTWVNAGACAAASHFQELSSGAPACGVLFHENQQTGGPSGDVQTKANSATLACDATGKLTWLVEHETWWPGASHGRDSCPALAARGIIGEAAPACSNCTQCLPGECAKCLAANASALAPYKRIYA